jgi:hypothetical protein
VRRWLGVLLTCGWVLWVHESPFPMQIWRLLDAFETKQACDIQRDARINQAIKDLGFHPVGDKLVMAGTDVERRYHCLPDTLDPRRPK